MNHSKCMDVAVPRLRNVKPLLDAGTDANWTYASNAFIDDCSTFSSHDSGTPRERCPNWSCAPPLRLLHHPAGFTVYSSSRLQVKRIPFALQWSKCKCHQLIFFFFFSTSGPLHASTKGDYHKSSIGSKTSVLTQIPSL
jgi:hypothetical protein